MAAAVCTLLFLWGFFILQNWKVGNFVDRYEGMVLRPFSLSISFVALYFLLHKAWCMGIVMLCWGLLIGAAASGILRNTRSNEQLWNPPEPIKTGELSRLSEEDSRRLGTTVIAVSFVSFLPALLLSFHYGLRWYIAFPVSAATSFVLGPVLLMICLFSAWPLRKKKISL